MTASPVSFLDWQGSGYVQSGDSRWFGNECQGNHRTHTHCHIRHGSAGWIAPYAANTQHPFYVPAGLWGGAPYWMGQGYVTSGDQRWLSKECQGSHRNHRHCYIRHGSAGWADPYVVANTNYPHYVPAAGWGGQPYWMGQGHIQLGDSRYLGNECQGSRRYHQHCHIRHGSPGWVAPYVAANTNFPTYVPAGAWGGQPCKLLVTRDL